MRLGISTAAYYGRLDTECAADQIRVLPVQCAEVFLQAQMEYTEPFVRDVRARLGDVRCTSVHVMGTLMENLFFSRSARQIRQAQDEYERILDAGAILGASCYVYHGRNSAMVQPLPFAPERNAEVVSRMDEMAARRGLRLAWENVSWCQLTTPERVRTMRTLLPDLRFTLDIKQAMRAGVDPIGFLPAMGEGLMNVHLCDWDASGTPCLPGRGVFDFGRFFRALQGNGYGGALILEPYANWAQETELIESLRFLRQALLDNIM